jgi:signal transduction histidine kinase
MLDDFGLQPALEWHVRDFSHRYNLPVQLEFAGALDHLPDPYRTCVYRVIQEALTNCARHASATLINVTVDGGGDDLRVAIKDDGVGLDPERRARGLGLRGIEERVRDLGGTMAIRAGRSAGTTLIIRLPLAAQLVRREARYARTGG